MAWIEGVHTQEASGRLVRYRAEYEVFGNVIHFHASFDPGVPYEGQFDFEPAQLDAAAAVHAFIRNHIDKPDPHVAP